MRVINVEKVDDKIYAATPYEIFYYNTSDNSINKLTKVNGLSDFGIDIMRYNPHTDMIFIGYSNTNIDIIDSEGNITNISDIKNKNILGNKKINDIYFIDDKAYLSCGFGIVLIDLNKMEIKETYIIGENGSFLNINDITLYNDKLYAATSNGIFYADYNNKNLVDFSQWTKDTTLIHKDLNYSEIETFNNQLLANYSRNEYNTDTLFIYDGNNWDYHDYETFSIKRNIRAYEDRVLMSANYSIIALDINNNVIQSYSSKIEPFDCIYDRSENVYWIADKENSICKLIPGKSCDPIIFNGPYSNSVFDLEIRGEQLWVAPGGYSSTWAKNWMKDGVFYYTNNEWHNINRYNTEAFDTITDIVSIAIDPRNNSKVYVGSFHKGIIEFENFKLKNIYNKENSSLGEMKSSNYTYVTGMDFDSKNNLWIANSGTENMLSVKTNTNEWFSFNIGSDDISKLMVDQNNYKWILTRDGKFIVFNDNNTIANTYDDTYKIVSTIGGQGGLPAEANCMAIDKSGTVWIGTNDGLAQFYSTSKIFKQGVSYDASRILVPRNDGSGQADYLLSGESVLSICVDDANNLWIGTKNGAFYISNNGLTEYQHFTQDNSPLLSNTINDIAINKHGDIFFGTDKGIISLRGRATEGKKTNSNVAVYPNPVRQGYSGVVGIKNLVTSSLVKITTVDGAFVTHLYSEGGQAIWDCTTINGDKVAPGIYLIFITDESGKETFATKILIM
ncbi:MAG: hypothetical protein J6U85_04915 [Bacteroidales bacterium]|nr:hypothetical protein [Bacteroidales bacterium]